MFKQIRSFSLILLLFFCFNTATQAQSIEAKAKGNAERYVKKIKANIELTDAEEEKIKELKIEHVTAVLQVSKKDRDAKEIKDDIRNVTVKYNKALAKAFGRERAKEIQAASRKKKE